MGPLNDFALCDHTIALNTGKVPCNQFPSLPGSWAAKRHIYRYFSLHSGKTHDNFHRTLHAAPPGHGHSPLTLSRCELHFSAINSDLQITRGILDVLGPNTLFALGAQGSSYYLESEIFTNYKSFACTANLCQMPFQKVQLPENMCVPRRSG